MTGTETERLLAKARIIGPEEAVVLTYAELSPQKKLVVKIVCDPMGGGDRMYPEVWSVHHSHLRDLVIGYPERTQKQVACLGDIRYQLIRMGGVLLASALGE